MSITDYFSKDAFTGFKISMVRFGTMLGVSTMLHTKFINTQNINPATTPNTHIGCKLSPLSPNKIMYMLVGFAFYELVTKQLFPNTITSY